MISQTSKFQLLIEKFTAPPNLFVDVLVETPIFVAKNACPLPRIAFSSTLYRKLLLQPKHAPPPAQARSSCRCGEKTASSAAANFRSRQSRAGVPAGQLAPASPLAPQPSTRFGERAGLTAGKATRDLPRREGADTSRRKFWAGAPTTHAFVSEFEMISKKIG